MRRSRFIFISIFTFFTICAIYGQLPEPPVPLPPEEEVIFKVVQEMPRFPGCESQDISTRKKEKCSKEKMLDFIYDIQKYPEEAKENEVDGMAVVQFVIWKDSTLRNIKIVRDPGSGIGEEAARIVEAMNHMQEKWTPGVQGGRQVCVQYTLPIKFKLDNKNTSRSSRDLNNTDIVRISDVHEDPMFPGCKKYKDYNCTTDRLEEFIKENQLYPQKALDNKTEGIAKISFIIEKDGSVSNIKALNKLPHGICDDAIEIIEWMNTENMRWKPGMQNYEPVRTLYKVDIAYDLAGWESRQ